MTRRIIILVTRLLLAGILLFAGWPKIAEPGGFIRDIWNVQLVPESVAFWVAAYIPFLEVVAALALITGLQRRGAHLLIGAMLLGFAAVHVSAWARGLDVSCGCFGAGTLASDVMPPIWWAALLAAMALALVVSIVADRARHAD